MEKWKMIMMVAVFAVWISAAAYAGGSAYGVARNDAWNRLCTDGCVGVDNCMGTMEGDCAIVDADCARRDGSVDVEGSTDSLRGIRRQELFAVDRTDTARAVSCYRIPAITTAPDGSLIAAIDERVPITDTVSGTVFLFYNYMDHDAAKDVYFFHVMRSTDNGRTWSAPEDITSQVAPEDWRSDFKFLTSGQGTVTRDGRLLHTMVNLRKGLHLIESTDHGLTWHLIPTPIVPADESKVIELPDGRWMVNSRVNEGGCRYIHISDDKGRSWTSNPAPGLPDPGCNGAIVNYPQYGEGGCLLFVNTADPEQRCKLTLRYSLNGGITWSDGLILVDGDAGYSDVTVLHSGEIAVFYERDGYTVNEAAVIDPECLFGVDKRASAGMILDIFSIFAEILWNQNG